MNSAQQYNDSGSESEFLMPEPEGEVQSATPGISMIVERVLGRKMMKNPDLENEFDELFYIKWKKMSYFHASWERKEDIERVDLQAKLKIKRFLQTPQALGILGEKSTKSSVIGPGNDIDGGIVDEEDDDYDFEIEYFNPEMAEIQRIISCETTSVSHASAKTFQDICILDKNEIDDDEDYINEDHVQYLVKWRGLTYSECTWERWEDLKGELHYQCLILFDAVLGKANCRPGSIREVLR